MLDCWLEHHSASSLWTSAIRIDRDRSCILLAFPIFYSLPLIRFMMFLAERYDIIITLVLLEVNHFVQLPYQLFQSLRILPNRDSLDRGGTVRIIFFFCPFDAFRDLVCNIFTALHDSRKVFGTVFGAEELVEMLVVK